MNNKDGNTLMMVGGGGGNTKGGLYSFGVVVSCQIILQPTNLICDLHEIALMQKNWVQIYV